MVIGPEHHDILLTNIYTVILILIHYILFISN